MSLAHITEMTDAELVASFEGAVTSAGPAEEVAALRAELLGRLAVKPTDALSEDETARVLATLFGTSRAAAGDPTIRNLAAKLREGYRLVARPGITPLVRITRRQLAELRACDFAPQLHQNARPPGKSPSLRHRAQRALLGAGLLTLYRTQAGAFCALTPEGRVRLRAEDESALARKTRAPRAGDPRRAPTDPRQLVVVVG